MRVRKQFLACFNVSDHGKARGWLQLNVDMTSNGVRGVLGCVPVVCFRDVLGCVPAVCFRDVFVCVPVVCFRAVKVEFHECLLPCMECLGPESSLTRAQKASSSFMYMSSRAAT